jgi:hypothetical protein
MRFRVAAVVFIAALAGCGSSGRAVLEEGIHSGASSGVVHIDDATARRDAALGLRRWEADLRRRSRLAPRERFANPAVRTLRDRVAAAARRHDFTVVRIKLLRPRQLAPLIVVRTTHYVHLAHATRDILRELDPRSTSGHLHRWGFEGIFFEALDERGVPFLTTFTTLRGPGPGGGQWARSDALYPFAHG